MRCGLFCYVPKRPARRGLSSQDEAATRHALDNYKAELEEINADIKKVRAVIDRLQDYLAKNSELSEAKKIKVNQAIIKAESLLQDCTKTKIQFKYTIDQLQETGMIKQPLSDLPDHLEAVSKKVALG